MDSRKRERGQVTIEAILIMTILTGLTIYATRFAQSKGFMASLVEGPWLPLRGMIESGVWEKPDVAAAKHPNLMLRHGTAKGDPP